MIIYNLCTHIVHQTIECLRSKSFEKCVFLPHTPHTIDNFRPVVVFVYHLLHRADIILSVAVDRYRDVRSVLRIHESCQNRILMPTVSTQRNTVEMLISLRKALDQFPCRIPAAVVDIQNTAFITDLIL